MDSGALRLRIPLDADADVADIAESQVTHRDDGPGCRVCLREKIKEKLDWKLTPCRHMDGVPAGVRELVELNTGRVTIELDGDWTYLCRVCGGSGPDETKWLATYLRSESTDRHIYEVKQTR